MDLVEEELVQKHSKDVVISVFVNEPLNMLVVQFRIDFCKNKQITASDWTLEKNESRVIEVCR
jgi:hypothetical protein